MGKRTCALLKGNAYTWTELLDKFNIEHKEYASAHVEWNKACLKRKLPKVEVVEWLDIEEYDERETIILPKENNITKRHKEFVWKRDIGNLKIGKCYVCSQPITDDNFETGHVVSRFNGGSNHVSNLRAVCLPCNRAMGTSNLEEFKKDFINSDINNFNEHLKNIEVTKEDVIEFFTLHKPDDANVKFFNKAIEILENCEE